jgi:hypothetical protein
MRTRLAPLFGAVVSAVGACDPEVGVRVPDASASDADADVDASDAGAPDVARDSYVVWCDAGPPELVLNAGCNSYLWIPCGLPPDDIVANGGAINRCDQICPTTIDDVCAVLDEPWIDIVFDAGDGSVMQNDGGVLVECACISGGAGRRPRGLMNAPIRARSLAGAWFARTACLEDASVIAFRDLGAQLTAFHVSPSLVRAAERAARDEIAHARLMARLARRFGGSPAPARVRKARARSVLAIAIENAVEGCVRETYAALVATWQARHARDAEVRRVMRRIARDETRHAELAARVDVALSPLLDRAQADRVERARVRAAERLRAELARDVAPELVRLAGLPSRESALALFDALWSILRR